ncbi:MAG: tripartite tricarboxylate transporter substrate-binding protein [Porticoccaceae bacterium]
MVSPKVKADSFEQLIELARTAERPMTFASSSIGAPGHLAGELFAQLSGLSLMHVPYRGSAPALTDLIGGQVDMMFDSAPSSIGFVRSGKLKALGVTSSSRSDVAPELPTLDESGMKGFAVTTWYGVWAPTIEDAKHPRSWAGGLRRPPAPNALGLRRKHGTIGVVFRLPYCCSHKSMLGIHIDIPTAAGLPPPKAISSLNLSSNSPSKLCNARR